MATNFCPTCGTEQKYPDAEICPNCGVRIKEQPLQGLNEIRNPWLAVIFSFFCPGWGQWYNGRTYEGLKFFGTVVAIYILIAIFAITLTSSIISAPLIIVLSLAYIVIWVYGMYDAYKMANRVNNKELEYEGKSKLFWLPIALIILWVIVIVAAVFAAFVFGMAGNVSATKSVALTAQKNSNGLITITNQGGRDMGSVTTFVITADGVAPTKPLGILVGSTTTIQGKSGTKNHVIATATFKDGSKQVILDTSV
ncbi:MAG: type IV pilin [Methanomicrobiales archaeon]